MRTATTRQRPATARQRRRRTPEEANPADAAGDSPADVTPDRPPSVRRPLLVGTSLRSASVVAREDWGAGDGTATAPDGVDAGTLAALAKAYALDGCEEHASIAAFARLTLHLLSVGAPPELIEKAHLASLDEIRHARSCFALARRYGGGALGPSALSIDDLFATGGAFVGVAFRTSPRCAPRRGAWAKRWACCSPRRRWRSRGTRSSERP
jgi:hypothetical protein